MFNLLEPTRFKVSKRPGLYLTCFACNAKGHKKNSQACSNKTFDKKWLNLEFFNVEESTEDANTDSND